MIRMSFIVALAILHALVPFTRSSGQDFSPDSAKPPDITVVGTKTGTPLEQLTGSVTILDEQLASTALAGLALIIAGVWVVNGGGLWLAARVFRNGRARTPRVAGGAEAEAEPSRKSTP